MHELGNATGIRDFSGFPYAEDIALGLPQSEANFDYTVMANNNPGHGWPTGPAPGENAYPPFSETPMLLDVQVLQYLYGANEHGFTTAGARHTTAGLVYGFTDNNDEECIWVGKAVPGITTFDFSACTGAVTINLNPDSFSSTGTTPANGGFPAAYTGTPYKNVSIAYGTTINIAIAGQNATSLIADTTPGHDDVMVGSTGKDKFTAGAGQDIFIGNGGADIATFHGKEASYTISKIAPGTILVTDNAAGGTDGTALLEGDFTALHFTDRTIAETPTSSSALAVKGPASVVTPNLSALQTLVAHSRITSIAAGDSTLLNDTSTGLSVTGAVASQKTSPGRAMNPFSIVIVADARAGQQETLTVTLSAAADGTLSNLGDGSYDAATGVYTVSGTTAAVMAAVRNLAFTPAAGATATTFAIKDTDSARASALNAITSVAISATAASVLFNQYIATGLHPAAAAATASTMRTAELDGSLPLLAAVSEGSRVGHLA